MRLTTLTLAAALAASLTLGACASRRPPLATQPAATSLPDPLGTPAGAAPAPGAGAQVGSEPFSTPMPGGAAAPGAGPGSMSAFVIEAGDRVFFDTDSHTLHDQAAATLSTQAEWLNRYPAVRVIVEGNADERGTREYNLALGARRANAVRDHLVSRGVSAARIETVSYGKERPIAEGSDDAAWSQNRNARTNFQGQGGL